jgi:hypothetical protein
MNKTNKKTLAIMVMVAIILFALVSGLFTQKPANSWQLNISSTPTNAGSTSPSGTIYININNSLTVNAYSNSNWTFSFWSYDGANISQTANITISPQQINSTHTLVANFILRLPAFQITPNKIFTPGIATSFALTFTNNEDVTIKNVRFKLNDQYGIFTKFGVAYQYKQGTSNGGINPSYYWKHENLNALNVYSGDGYATAGTVFEINGGSINGGTSTYIVQPHSSIQFYCGDDYWGLNPTVSSTIQAGVYHLTWNIYFEVSSGTFSEAPSLTIPWDVTII